MPKPRLSHPHHFWHAKDEAVFMTSSWRNRYFSGKGWYCGCDYTAVVQQEWRQRQLPVGLQVIAGFDVSPWKSVLGHSLVAVLLFSYKYVQSLLTHDPAVSLYPCKSVLRNSFVEVCLPASPPVLFSSGKHAARAGWTLIRHCMGWWGSSSLGKNTH